MTIPSHFHTRWSQKTVTYRFRPSLPIENTCYQRIRNWHSAGYSIWRQVVFRDITIRTHFCACSSTYKVNIDLSSDDPPTEVISQSPAEHNIVKFIDLMLMTGFLKQNGSRFTMMNDQEAKCAGIVFFCIVLAAPISWVSNFYWWTNFKRHWRVGYSLIAMLTCIVFSWSDNKGTFYADLQ